MSNRLISMLVSKAKDAHRIAINRPLGDSLGEVFRAQRAKFLAAARELKDAAARCEESTGEPPSISGSTYKRY